MKVHPREPYYSVLERIIIESGEKEVLKNE
jgi:hypothetical protein